MSKVSYDYSGNIGYFTFLTAADGSRTSDVLTFDSGTANISLKHGESVTLNDLSPGLGYTVAETNAADYAAAYSVNGAAAVNGRSVSSVLTENTNIAFANVKQAVIPTGVDLPTMGLLPVLLLLLICLTIAVKRRYDT